MPNLRAIYRKLTASDFSRRHLLWCLALGLLSACMFGKYLVSASQVLSAPGTDSFAYYIYTYKLAFDGFINGDLVLWNPYNYGGQPFLGQMQSALFYPPNWLVAWMPVATAMNCLVFGHQWLLGLGIYGWSTLRGHRPAGAFLAAALMMFGAPYMLHAYAGHMSNLASMAWIPFIFWGIDGWLAKRDYRWILLAAGSAALQIYSGHSQYFYYTAIVAGLYSLIFLRPVAGKPRALLGLVLIWPVALTLAAAQFLPGLAAASESVRAGGAGREFASMFAFPPENILTLVAPWFFGNMTDAPYWGRCYLWEMSLFFGAGGLVLALNGLAAERRRWPYVILFAIITLLALGARTPLYEIFYRVLPGFSMFRGTSKFIFFLVMFLALLAGRGFDGLLAGKKAPRWLWAGALALGAVAIVAGSLMGGGTWENLARDLAALGQKSGEYYLNPKFFETPDFGAKLAAAGGWSLALGGGVLIAAGALLLAAQKQTRLAWAVGAVALAEVLLVARQSVASFPAAEAGYPAIKDFLAKNPGDYRTLNMLNPESAIELKSEGVWGYDPFVLKRYAEFVHYANGLSPDRASQSIPKWEWRVPAMLAMLRGRLAFVPENNTIRVVPLQDPLSRFYVVANHRVLKGRDEIFAEMSKPGFNPKNEVLLEENPVLAPDPGAGQYSIRLLNMSTDHWTLEVQTQFSAFLVMTDAYSKDWRVRSLPDPMNPTLSNSVQVSYELLPAYHALRAIPLAPGVHRIRIEYVPSGLALGAKLTLAGLLFSGLFLWVPCFKRAANALLNPLTATPSVPPRSIDLEYVACADCGGGAADNEIMHRKTGESGVTYNIVRCKNCGLAFVNPRLTQEAIMATYRNAAYFQRGEDATTGYNNYTVDKELHQRFFRTQLDAIEKHAKKGRLLDVGCAFGYLLSEARQRGWKPEGIELSSNAFVHVRDELKLPVHDKPLREVAFPANSFNAVVMDDVIEHYGDPVSEIAEVRRVLVKGGVFLLHTPNFDSLWRDLMEERWVHLKPEEHLYYFSPATLSALLKKNGFEVIYARTRGKATNLAYIFGVLKKILPRLGNLLEKTIGRLPPAKWPFSFRGGGFEVLAVKK